MSTLDAPTIEQFKEKIRKEWTATSTTAAWRKWHPQFAAQSTAATAAIMEAARVERGLRILDLASGTGEPALSLARAIAPNGHVTATDLAQDLLAIAEQRARQAGVSNLAFQLADAHALPFPDSSFDRVTCRLGVMLFADCQQALREVHRVLKPGGRAAFVAPGPLEQAHWLLVALGPLMKRVQVPPPPPGAPQPFKFAQQGTLRQELEAAGFRQMEEEQRTVPWPFPGTPEEQWEMFFDLAYYFHPLIESLSPEERAQYEAEVVAGYRQSYDGEQVGGTTGIVVATGVR